MLLLLVVGITVAYYFISYYSYIVSFFCFFDGTIHDVSVGLMSP